MTSWQWDGGGKPRGGGGADAGGGGGGGKFRWNGGGAPRVGTTKVRAPRAPEDDLTSSLVRLAKTLPNVQDSGDRERIERTLITKTPGLKPKQVDRIYQSLRGKPMFNDLANRLLIGNAKKHAGPNSALDYLNPVTASGAVLGKTLDIASGLGQGVQSTVAEATREGGWQHADIGKLLTAAKEGAQHKRQDTISSIVQENTGTKLKGLGKFAADLGGSIALDPLTYASFGLSEAAKVGIRTSTEVLGAARTGEIMRGGAKSISAAEDVLLAKSMTKPVLEAFHKGVRGGLKVSHPTFNMDTIRARHSLLSEPRTIVPGPFAQAKAGRIIEGAGARLTGDVAAEAENLGKVAEDWSKKAKEFHAQANLSELGGGDPARVANLRLEARRAEELAHQVTTRVGDLEAAQVRTAAAAGRTLTDNPFSRALAKIGDTPIARTARGLFVPRGNVARDFGEAAAKGLDDARVLYRGEYQAAVEDHVNTLIHAAKDTGVTNDELRNIVGPALDIGGDVSKVPDRLRPMYDALAKVRDRFTKAQIDAGVTSEHAIHITDEYFPRYLTDQAQKIITGKEGRGLLPAVPGEASITRAPSGMLRARTANVDEPISEINPAFEAEHGVPKFEDNPLPVFSKRGMLAEQDVATKHYVDRALKLRDDAGHRLMYTADEVKAGKLTIPKDWGETKIPGVGTVHAPNEILGEVKKSYELLVNDQHLKSLLGGLDKWMTLWKGYATVPLPFGLGFHERNAIGNVFNNWLAGINPADSAYRTAAAIQNKVWRGVRGHGDPFELLSLSERRIVESARQHDIIGGGFFQFDLPKNNSVAVHVPFRKATGKEAVTIPGTKVTFDVPTKLKRTAKAANPLNPSNALLSTGRKVGSAIEENARLAHFISMEKKFGNAADAARSVRKYLFDYSDLTAAERQVFKRTMAFYTFTRKNLPVQVGALLRTPGKFSHLREAQVAVADTAPKPKGLYPSYLPELGGIPLPMSISQGLSKVPLLGVKSDQQLVYAPDLPLINATSSVSPIVQLLSSLPGVDKIPGLPHNPEGPGGAFRDFATQTVSGGAPGAFMSGVQALAAEKDFFSGRPLQGRVAAPAYARFPGLSQDRVLNGKKQPTISTKAQYLAESLLPLLGKVSSFAPQGAYEQEKAPRRRLSTFLGTRVYPLGPGTSRGEALRRNQIVQQLMADLRAKGVDIESSRTKKKKKGGW